jgi:hypothetical protein
MSSGPAIDGVLVWGERLFYPRNRTVQAGTPRLHGQSRARAIRSRIEATVRRAPQVMVKVTGGGRGMAAIRAHFCYISKNGRLDIEDDRGAVEQGKEAVKDIERQWQFGGAYIGEEGHRREAFNVMLSMPRAPILSSFRERPASSPRSSSPITATSWCCTTTRRTRTCT